MDATAIVASILAKDGKLLDENSGLNQSVAVMDHVLSYVHMENHVQICGNKYLLIAEELPEELGSEIRAGRYATHHSFPSLTRRHP